MILFPNAKINLGLNIVERRPDGYHNIETIFYPIALQDILEVVPSSGKESTLTTYGREINCPVEKNLVMKTFRLFEKEFNLPPVNIFLHKNIPDGAGLGGGSSDAASTIIALNDIFNIGLSKEDMAVRASKLGADCPFFIYNTPMTATGIGEILNPIDVDLKGKFILLIKPDVSVPTAEAYSRVIPKPSKKLLSQIISLPLSEWKDNLVNDFEMSVFANHPSLLDLKTNIYKSGAIYASMSGSGSSIFGIFDNVILAESAKQNFPNLSCYVIAL